MKWFRAPQVVLESSLVVIYHIISLSTIAVTAVGNHIGKTNRHKRSRRHFLTSSYLFQATICITASSRRVAESYASWLCHSDRVMHKKLRVRVGTNALLRAHSNLKCISMPPMWRHWPEDSIVCVSILWYSWPEFWQIQDIYKFTSSWISSSIWARHFWWCTTSAMFVGSFRFTSKSWIVDVVLTWGVVLVSIFLCCCFT